MKSNKFLSMAAIAIMLMASQQAEAQFLKKLGKVAEGVGKAVLESATNPTSEAQLQSTQPSSEGVTTTTGQRVVTGHPDFKIEFNRCVASGTNVVLDLVVTNTGATDVKQFKVHGSEYQTKLYDNLGNIYEKEVYVKIANKEYTTWGHDIRLVSSLPTSFSILIKDVDPRATSFALVEPDVRSSDWGITYETVKLRNIPITREE